MNFHETLLVTVLDKGLLAGALAFAAFRFGRVLETHKAVEARQTEYMKQQMLAMNAAWSTIYVWMNECDKLFTDQPLSLREHEVNTFRKSILAQAETLMTNLAEQRFFCGENFTQDCLDFCNSRLRYYMELDPTVQPYPSAPKPPWADVQSVQEKYLKTNPASNKAQ